MKTEKITVNNQYKSIQVILYNKMHKTFFKFLLTPRYFQSFFVNHAAVLQCNFLNKVIAGNFLGREI